MANAYRRRRGRAAALAAAALLTVCLYLFFARLRPTAAQVAVSETEDVVTEILNDAVLTLLRRGTFSYADLVTLEKDKNGRITALVTDMAGVSRLQAEVSNIVLQQMNEHAAVLTKIPFGTLTGSALLAGLGPKIPVRVASVSNVYTNFIHEFSGAGINQTRHNIFLDLEVEVEVLLPGYSGVTTVSTRIPVAETIIVGDVPGTYADFGGD